MSHEIPISSLQPSSITPTASVRGAITLVWPYSQSTKQCAILLAAEDFRLRAQRGQVRIIFSGTAADAVAKSKAGISDKLILSLRGARWHASTDVRTPGKSVDGELEFRNVLDLTIIDSDGHIREVSTRALSPDRNATETQSTSDTIPKTPASSGRYVAAIGTPLDTVKDIFNSPAFLKKASATADVRHDPFFDVEDEEQPRKRVRVSLGQVRDWRYTDRSSSPEKEDDGDFVKDNTGIMAEEQIPAKTTLPIHEGQIEIGELEDAPHDPASVVASMQPPPLPRLRVRVTHPELEDSHVISQTRTPTTPKLEPVSTSALPLPSPFPEGNMQSHFDAATASIEASTPNAPVISPAITQRIGPRDEVSTVESPSYSVQPLSTQSGTSSDPDLSHRRAPSPPASRPGSPSLSAPKTQDKLPDGAAPGSLETTTRRYGRVTVASQEMNEREQTHNRTLSSLFGFGRTSSATVRSSVVQETEGQARILSEFEVAESEAMDQLLSREKAHGDPDTLPVAVVHDQGTIIPP